MQNVLAFLPVLPIRAKLIYRLEVSITVCLAHVCVCVRLRACVRACVRAYACARARRVCVYVRACLRAPVRACVYACKNHLSATTNSLYDC